MYKIFYAKKIVLILAFIAVVSYFVVDTAAIIYDSQTVLQNDDVRKYLQNVGITVNDDAVRVENITIPEKFNDTYNRYNYIQKLSGYNIEDYRGRNVRKFTYYLTCSEPTEINVLVYKNRVIGGDVYSSVSENDILPLKASSLNLGE